MWRLWLSLMFLLPGLSVHTNEDSVGSLNADNKLFIIVIDGLRWQEVFAGSDSTILAQPAHSNIEHQTQAIFGSAYAEERRKKLLPFFWNTIARQGSLYGNRVLGNKMNLANPYALSYPGYNELLTGRVDPWLFSNEKATNENSSVLDYLNNTVMYNGKIAAFASWDAFPAILNKARSSVYINSEDEPVQQAENPEAMLNNIEENLNDTKKIRDDRLTFAACSDYIQKKKPSVVFLSFAGTDEAAHNKQYDVYLQQASNADRMIGELWQQVQSLPEYCGKTTFLITTDHGRGNGAGNWFTHGAFVNGSSGTWMAVLGKGVQPHGEIKVRAQLYQKDLKDLMLRFLTLE